ncbi:microsomal glutathione s-transferase [Naegleria gruberi]|uniref:Microsomal glutathione S-transferase 1 n=1 Tax=Naegleria gruberi TaxID=5762 RepID=D2VJS5_NAEGR|nr:microsomal glutathione s-transferase [Naegleria gruberi]EFC43084.1 microsomal glutathione s-transferase [Naegleria gruberi]|eukprot:XP_002675828.1 microsomal glutathione s-transferase [Naegleria gruberi strain NEG-M]
MQPLILYNPVLQGFVYNVFLLMFRLFIAAQITGISKMIDAMSTKKQKQALNNSNYSLEDQKPSSWASRAELAGNIHRNDIENVVPFIMIAIPYVIISTMSYTSITDPQYSLWNAIVGNILMASFTLSRMVYFFMYWFNLPPLRTLVWLWGLLSTVCLAIYTIVCMYVL